MGQPMTVKKSRAGYAVVYEKSVTGFGAYVPDLPGCIAAGRTLENTEELMNAAIVFHQQGIRRQGNKVPRPRSLETLRAKKLV
jgi:predicted RNase H-like HicB family nuclease